jgi:hypothetical protein
MHNRTRPVVPGAYWTVTGRCLHRVRSCDHRVRSSDKKRISLFLTVRSDLVFHLFRLKSAANSLSSRALPSCRAAAPRRALAPTPCSRAAPSSPAPAPCLRATLPRLPISTAAAPPHLHSSRKRRRLAHHHGPVCHHRRAVQRATAVEPTRAHKARTRCRFSERNPNPSHPNPFVEAFFMKFSTPRTSPSPQGDITALD